MIRRAVTTALLLALALGVAAGAARAIDPVDAARERGVAFLLAQQQPDGGFNGHVGITSVVLLALLAPPAGPGEAVRRAFAYVERQVQPDGGIYQTDVKHYTTAVATLAMVAGGDARHRPAVARARDYLLALQAREDNGFPPSHPLHGATLIGDGKGNLDATFFTARALREAGLPPEHPYWARLLRFVSRCQNLRPANDQPWAATDGGFVFSPGFSFAGGTTSYGTMTYAGAAAYHDAGLPREDPRVAAALGWLAANFTAEENPGLAKQTLYHSYFYMTHTLPRWGLDDLPDGRGGARAWRRELAKALTARQRGDGSWVNDDPRWWESNPVLATAFAVRALKEAAGQRR